MFSQTQLTGAHLPAKTLCLTFDDGPGETFGDGPGPKTPLLAQYLGEENIGATFFVLGRHALQRPDIVRQAVRLGHIVGNHTVNHPNFAKLTSFKEAVAEMHEAHKVIVENNHNAHLYFRAPYGSWPEGYAHHVNQHLGAAKQYIGPIAWDVNENDWNFWGGRRSALECADAYFDAIVKAGKGIIVMHDSTAEQDDMGKLRRDNNRTFEAVKILVPRLKSLGYTFVALDEIPF
jgi:peptidoglycan/xylan/chitin deacetylase (PgdA/CDA1 family)